MQSQHVLAGGLTSDWDCTCEGLPKWELGPLPTQIRSRKARQRLLRVMSI